MLSGALYKATPVHPALKESVSSIQEPRNVGTVMLWSSLRE